MREADVGCRVPHARTYSRKMTTTLLKSTTGKIETETNSRYLASETKENDVGEELETILTRYIQAHVSGKVHAQKQLESEIRKRCCALHCDRQG